MQINNPRALSLILSLLFSIITLGVWYKVKEVNSITYQEKFNFQAKEAISNIESRMATYQQVLRGTRGLFESFNSVSRKQFRNYVASLKLEDNFPGIQGLGFSVIVPPEQKQQHIAEIRENQYPEYDISPAGKRKLYTSIIYLEPFDYRNARAFGYDMYSNNVRREAMERARDNDQPAMSGKVRLVQETGKKEQSGFLVYHPVYIKGSINNTLKNRRDNLIGWVYSPFRMGDLMEGVFGQDSSNVHVEIFDGVKQSQASALYVSGNYLYSASNRNEKVESLQGSYKLKVAGRIWTIKVTASRNFYQNIKVIDPLLVLIIGFTSSTLSGLILWLLIHKRDKEVKQEQLELNEERIRKLYETTPAILQSTDSDGQLISVSDLWLEKHGYAREEVIGKKFTMFMTPESAERATQAAIPLLFEKDFIENFTYRGVKKNGDVFDVSLSSILERDVNRVPVRSMSVLLDMTSEKAAIRSSDELLATIRNQFIMSITDANGIIVDVNEAFCQISMYKKEELIGQNHRMINSNHHEKIFFSNMWKSISAGNTWQGEICNRAKDGSLYWVASVISPLNDNSGKIVKYLSIRTDITERVTNAEKLKNNQNLLSQTGMLAGVGGWELDLKTNVPTWTDITKKIHLVPADYKPKLDTAIDFYAPEARPLIESAISTAIEFGKPWDLELPLIQTNGNRIWVRSIGNVEYKHGKPIKLYGALQDLTKAVKHKRELEVLNQRVNLATNSANIGIWDLSVLDKSLMWDTQMFTLYGYKEDVNTINFDLWKQNIHPDDYIRVMKELDNAINEVKPFNTEFKIVWQDNSVHYIRATATPNYDEKGKVINMIGANWDVTETRVLDLDLQQAYTDLEEFTEIASHDLKSPLRGISDLLEWVTEDLGLHVEEVVKNNLHRIQVRVKLIETLIEDLLQYSRAGKVDAEKSLLKPIEMVHEILELVYVPASFTITVDGKVLPFVTSTTPLKTIIRNLITNAIKHHDKNMGTIGINISSKNNFCVFVIKDDGPGIPEIAHQRVFKLFQTLEKSDNPSGLGLAMSKRMIEAHGGEIKLDSDANNRGATFTVFWPMK